MEEEFLKNIGEKLDIIIKLLCSKCIEGRIKTDSIRILDTLGIDRKLICEITGSTSASIRSTVCAAKKQNDKHQSKKKSREAQPNEKPE